MTHVRLLNLALLPLCAALALGLPLSMRADEPPATLDRVETESVPPWNSGDYAYDGSGSIRSIGSDRYVYDSLGRLVSGTAGGGLSTQSYTYDGFGNIKTITTTGKPTRTLNVNSATNRLDGSVPGANYIATYDAAGNQISENGISPRTFDAFNNLAVNSNGAQFIYDANDERIATTNASRTDWRWTVRDLSGRELREFDESVNGGVSTWTWRKDFVYRGSSLLGAYVNENGVEKRIHYHLDQLGTPRLITDASAIGKLEINDYPFGEEYTFNVGSTETRHFTGHERDYNGGTAAENTDYLDYMHARFYAPAAGRFLSVDPTWSSADLGKPESWNRYSYVLNNPVRYTDPDGRCTAAVVDCVLEGGAVAGPVGAAVGVVVGVGVIAVGTQINWSEVGEFLTQAGMNDSGGSGGERFAERWIRQNNASHMAEQSEQEAKKDPKRRFSKADREAGLDKSKDAEGTPRCEYCGNKLDQKAGKGNSYEADHRDPHAQGGRTKQENLAPSCRDCNREKGNRTPEQWQKDKDKVRHQ